LEAKGELVVLAAAGKAQQEQMPLVRLAVTEVMGLLLLLQAHL
jgi:hypothetical protein